MKIKLHYEEKGTGQPMVLLHGNGEDSSYFKNQIEYFSKKYRVIAGGTTRGHGKIRAGNGSLHSAPVRQRFKELSGRDGAAPDHSSGLQRRGKYRPDFTILHPQYVDRLLLNGANLNPWGMKAGVFKNIYLAYWKACLRIAKGERKKHKTEDDRYLLEKARRKGTYGLMIKEPHIRPVYLKTMRKPVLVIAGTKDMIRTGHTKKIHRLIPGSRLCLLNGTHFIASENSWNLTRRQSGFWKAETDEVSEKQDSKACRMERAARLRSCDSDYPGTGAVRRAV